MKIVHINTYDGNGGAGRAVLRLNKGLQLIGADSQVVCLYQFNAQSGVQAISHSVGGKMRAVARIFAERYLVKPFLKDSSIPFSLQRFGFSPSEISSLHDADIIHIHWINHGFFAPADIACLAALRKKIFWTLHDSNPITGGCHVRYGCQRFQEQCGYCPVLKHSGPNDLSHRTWAKKQQAYDKLKFTFIAPSSWMGERAKEASLSVGKPVSVISNALETDIFKPADRAACRREFGVGQDDLVILAGYMPSRSDRHKGFPQLLEAIRHLASTPGINKERLLLLFYGSDGAGLEPDIPIRHRFAGRISSDQVLVKLYSLADVFLFPSIEESMGYTALESISCGTPVVAFSTSGVTDIVQHKINGYLAPLYDTREMANGLAYILLGADHEALSKAARAHAVSNFSLEIIARKHLDLYQECFGRT